MCVSEKERVRERENERERDSEREGERGESKVGIMVLGGTVNCSSLISSQIKIEGRQKK